MLDFFQKIFIFVVIIVFIYFCFEKSAIFFDFSEIPTLLRLYFCNSEFLKINPFISCFHNFFYEKKKFNLICFEFWIKNIYIFKITF